MRRSVASLLLSLAAALAFAQPVPSVDCVPGAPGCEPLRIRGDAPYILPNGKPSPFSGFADPCLRRDPEDGTLVLAYSWPHFIFEGKEHIPGVSLKYAVSKDEGRTWEHRGILWEPEARSNPARSGMPGLLDHETISFWPVREGEATRWFAARLNYFVPRSGGYAARPNDSFHISVTEADSFAGLMKARDWSRLGGSLTHPAWKAYALVPPELKGAYFFWNEPSVLYEGGRLYLILVAFVYQGADPDMPRNEVFVYSTLLEGRPSSWVWEYEGRLVSSADARELGGQRLSQTEVTRGTDGRLLLLATPDDWVPGLRDFNHKGTVILEIESLERSALRRDAEGRLVVLGRITASDAGPLGSAAASYDPSSATGVLLTRRKKDAGTLTAEIWTTGLRP